ncbi:hypothetical protein [Spirochaeta cellobiosiphila]|uniref:hypothetical protein n=1 Tax=Spirochaeta cellobiosiphila TaxID=504483 RepID=UPI000490AE53|nr:hypothetical protein [Spirochaeta cellobiosiphila]
MPNWKIPSIIGGISLVFAILLGMISKVSLITVLWRSLFSGILMGGFSFGTSFILSRFLPELGNSSDVPDIDNDDFNNESRVNIVLPEDNGFAPVAEDDNEEAVEVIEAIDEDGPAPAKDMDRISSQNLGDVDNLPDMDSFSADFAEGTFVEEGSEASESSISDSSSQYESAEVDVAGMQSSPQEIAKAVQTIMKKD